MMHIRLLTGLPADRAFVTAEAIQRAETDLISKSRLDGSVQRIAATRHGRTSCLIVRKHYEELKEAVRQHQTINQQEKRILLAVRDRPGSTHS